MSSVRKSQKIGINSLIKTVCEEPKSKRFSTMSENELNNLWKDISSFVYNQIHNNKSIFIPGLAHFYVNKEKKNDSTVHYVPAHTWDKIPGLRITRPLIQKMSPSETINFSMISNEKNYSRDDAETGLKDLTHAIMNALITGNSLNLNLPKVGYLLVVSKQFKFRFDPEFIKSLDSSEPNIRSTTENVKEALLPPLVPNNNVNQSTVMCEEKIKTVTFSTSKLSDQDTMEEIHTSKCENLNSQRNHLPEQTADPSNTFSTPKTQQSLPIVKKSEKIIGVRGMSILEPMKGILPILPPLIDKSECWTEERQ
ncbi:Coiled-coil domain-containing protein 81 [Clydaea vesicula]|uniref:Coiled-coil domain-containing protein 81 n=1 Tax=Clydaea vesicula TaxID=447962 RepID=A0AAD5TY72_9FUNG|nr:Coiled-coil domain-containing protein 81 [Clydaea vesicula]